MTELAAGGQRVLVTAGASGIGRAIVEALLAENGGGCMVAISSSASMSVCLSDCGDVYSWGATEGKGGLGHGLANFQPLPRRVVGVKRAVGVA